jgi:hypothetical protein
LASRRAILGIDVDKRRPFHPVGARTKGGAVGLGDEPRALEHVEKKTPSDGGELRIADILSGMFTSESFSHERASFERHIISLHFSVAK